MSTTLLWDMIRFEMVVWEARSGCATFFDETSAASCARCIRISLTSSDSWAWTPSIFESTSDKLASARFEAVLTVSFLEGGGTK